MFLTAIIIAVLARKLEFNRWEKHVHNFVLNTELARRRKIQAANIVKLTLKVWYFKNKSKSGSFLRYVQVQRELFRSVHLLQEIKREQRRLIDNCVDLTDIISIQRDTNDKTHDNANELKMVKINIDNIEEKLADMHINMNSSINNIQKKLNILLEKVTK